MYAYIPNSRGPTILHFHIGIQLFLIPIAKHILTTGFAQNHAIVPHFLKIRKMDTTLHLYV